MDDREHLVACRRDGVVGLRIHRKRQPARAEEDFNARA
jgi:hypothetical protein